MLVSLPVRDVMTETVETIGTDATAAEVAERIAASEHTSVVVCDGRQPAGIVTESDVVRLYAEATPRDTPVTEFMSADLVVIGPDEPVERAAEVLGERDVRRLPVVEDGRIVGIVTVSDVAYYLPHVLRDRRAWAERTRKRAAGGSTAYEEEGWEFESKGTEDGLDVGDVVRFTKTVSAADVEAFAEATGDTNRLHLEEAFAARSRFGERIAHGVLGSGVVSAALARIPGLTIFLSQELSYLAPVELGETVTAVCEVVEDLGNHRYRLSTELFDGEGECVIDGEAVVLLDDLPDEAEGDDAEGEIEEGEEEKDEDALSADATSR
jgi:acyl dehydratase/CBS domain-containing protein